MTPADRQKFAGAIARGIFDELHVEGEKAPRLHVHLPESLKLDALPAPQVEVHLAELVEAIRQVLIEQKTPIIDMAPVGQALIEALAQQEPPEVNVDLKPVAKAIVEALDRLTAAVAASQRQRPMRIEVERDADGRMTGCTCIPQGD